MARIRTVKPEFWIDERVGECSPTSRLLFIATWNFADDNGNLERSARQIKAQALPYDNLDCEPLLLELLEHGLLSEYAVNGHKYLHINGFEKHQKIEKKSAPRCPLPDSSPTTPRLVTVVREGKVKEGKVGDVGDSPVFTIAKAHPKLSHLRDDSEIPYAVVGAILEAIAKDGIEAVLTGTQGWAESLDDPKFAIDPYKFFSQFKYRPEAWKRGDTKPSRTESLLRSVSEISS